MLKKRALWFSLVSCAIICCSNAWALYSRAIYNNSNEEWTIRYSATAESAGCGAYPVLLAEGDMCSEHDMNTQRCKLKSHRAIEVQYLEGDNCRMRGKVYITDHNTKEQSFDYGCESPYISCKPYISPGGNTRPVDLNGDDRDTGGNIAINGNEWPK